MTPTRPSVPPPRPPLFAWVVVDGYSLLHHERRIAGNKRGTLLAAREKLLQELAEVLGVLAERITVVFDGQSGLPAGGDALPPGLEAVYSPSDQTADTVIERLAHEQAATPGLLVVTSDHVERNTVGSRGVATMGCTEFMERFARCRREISAALSAPRPRPRLGSLEDLLP